MHILSANIIIICTCQVQIYGKMHLISANFWGVQLPHESKSVRGEVSYHHIQWMHEVVPSVVAIAVRIVMTKCRIFCQSSLFMEVESFFEF